MPRIAAKMEPAMIDVMFLLVAELFKATVGEAVSRELEEVGPDNPTRLESEGTTVVEPARTVGWGPAPDDKDSAGTGFEEELFVTCEDAGKGVGVGEACGPGVELFWTFGCWI